MNEPAAETPVLVAHPQPGLAVVTLNRPAAMNALSIAMRRQFATVMAELERDAATRVVIVTGAGSAFCAGLDLRELGHDAAGLASTGTDDPVSAILGFSGPVIGAVNGAAVTGGLELALACDLLIASEAARFADTHVRMGVMPGWGLSQRLPRLIGVARAKEMAFTGNFVAAEQAERWGIVNRVVRADALMAVALALAGDMLSAEPDMVSRYKRVIDAGYAMPLDAGLAMERREASAHNDAVSPDALAARRGAVQARARGAGH